ncbi:hypothetical protein EDF20_0865 [Frigoribacterium sp. PhB116]|nr:hypothetical protein EDF20_0865 [Frigoribacterium sp. PhB116]
MRQTQLVMSEAGTVPRVRRTIGRWWAPALLVLMAVVSVAVHVPENTAISPIDEYVYADYIQQMPERPVVAQGDLTGPEAREALICLGNRGIQPPAEPSCEDAATAPSSEFVMGGKTSADIYTPFYFVTTWAVAQPLVALGVGLLDAASLVGALWLSLALVLLWLALRSLRVPDAVTVGIGALLVASPSAYWSTTYVSTDAPSLAVGAALLWLVLRVVRGQGGLTAVVLVSVVGVLFKVQNIAAVAFAALALLIWAVGEASSGDRVGRARRVLRSLVSRPVVAGVVAVVGSVVAQGAWLVVRSAIAVGPSADQGTALPLTAKGVLSESLKFLSGTGLDPTGGMNGIAISTAGVLVSWLSVAGVIAMVVLAGRRSAESVVAWSALVVSLVIGPVLVLGVSAVTHYYFSLPTRYGISLLPAFLACAAMLVSRRRSAGLVLASGGGLLWLLSLVSS